MSNQFGSFSDEMEIEAVERNQTVQQTKQAAKAAVTGAIAGTANQVKAAASDTANQLLSALYGPSTSSIDEQSPDNAGVSAGQAHKPQASKSTQSDPSQQPTDPTTQAEAQAAKKNIQELEAEIRKLAHEREQQDMQRKQQEEEEKQQRVQQAAAQNQQLAVPGGKRSGMPTQKTSMQHSQTKIEDKSGSSMG